MIRDTHLKKCIYRAKKHYDRKGMAEMVAGVQKLCAISADCCSRTKNLASQEDSLPFPFFPENLHIKIGSSSQVTCSLDLSKAGKDRVAAMYAVLLDLNTRSKGDAAFSLKYSSLTDTGEAIASVTSKDGLLYVSFSSTCSNTATFEEKQESLRGALAIFESALESPGKFASDFHKISTRPGSDFFFSTKQPITVHDVEGTIAQLISAKVPRSYKRHRASLFLVRPASWTIEDFNRNVQLINDNREFCKDASIIYTWSPAKWQDYEVLEDLYGLFGTADTDACLFEFTLPSGKAGMTAMTYGKKGYRLYVSFDDATAIKEFEKLTGVKCEVF